jgi:hypothetical protein
MDSGFGSGFHSTIMGGQGATKTFLNSHLSTGRSQRLPCRLSPARVIRGKAVQDDRLVGLQPLSPGRGESVLSYPHFTRIFRVYIVPFCHGLTVMDPGNPWKSLTGVHLRMGR